ncbi:NAD-dependent epimerase/dehydratase family protein [Streptomyces sp. WAC05374]|uniref:NAD(P)H-binding protein n=1 Tax=Streptomyces sp. WAC05374 TaxID=2487420 RepID=UPI000F88E8F3|nr:NAD(P)H-binding protein [Streptomyces sp. WAC05374]RST16656.1 NAD-dependent epimerase/dehydratase family protein [Streptomyces sp. WAC05374]TDF35983.1 NAD-dependent epimerase/dehydratase family protein [Streptomyces sp. WAC05374]TDF44546.1 NAD-dependent epimerase/dehydratase family protein [Streptomyces sp. WAC05374]TDF45676.1 NAD-dependent epimerase/dehydratase family protein [Streptomyces sp. WAC05374]
MTVLVTGATGSVGRHVVERLVAEGATVRALTRNPATAGLPDGVAVFEGDLTDPGTLRAALRGVERLYLFPVPETAREVVAAAKEAGVSRIVVLSSSSVLDESGDNHSGEYHRAVERAVEESGIDWTFVRPDEFATNVLWKWGHSIRTEGVVRAPYGDAPRVLIHEADVAAVAVAALLQEGHAGKAYVLTGPEAITQADQVRAISGALGREIRFEEITPDQARELMGRAMPAPVVEMVLGYLADALVNPPAVADTVERVTGVPARTFARWAADHAADFAPAAGELAA